MNLDSLSFALSQISYSVANLTKKNYKSSVAEISHLVAHHGAEAERHLFRCLFSHVDFSGDGKSSGKDFHQTQYLIQECVPLLTKPNFVSTLCYAIDNPLHHQKSLKASSHLNLQLSKVLKLNRVQEVVFGLAQLNSTNTETRTYAAQFVKNKLPPLLNSYVDDGLSGEGGLQDVAVEVLHLLLTNLVHNRQQLGITAQQKEDFLKVLKKDFPKDRVPVVLAPLLYPESQDLEVEKLVPVSANMPKSAMEGSLADVVLEMGYVFTSSAEECRNTLVQFGVREITPEAVARVLAAMARTPTGLSDQISIQNMNNPSGSNVWTDGKDKPDSAGPNMWNVDIFVQVVKELASHLVWRDVVLKLDQADFIIQNKQGLRILTQGLFRGLTDVFPIEALCQPWKNTEGQLSWITQALKNPDVFCLADYPCHPVVIDILKTPPDEDNRDIATWKSLDLVETLLRLSEAGHYQQVSELYKFPVQHCPDMLVLALLQMNTWTSLKHELLSSLMPIFLGNHPNSAIVLHYSWHCQGQSTTIRTLIMHAMAEWYMRGEHHDQTRLSRILDVAQDLKALSMLLNATPFAFVIDLACLASRREYLKLDKWLTDKIREHGEPFVQASSNFLKRRCPQLVGGIMKDEQQPQIKSQQIPPDTLATMLTCIQACAPSVAQELSDTIMTMVANANVILKPRTAPPGVVGSKAGPIVPPTPMQGLPNPVGNNSMDTMGGLPQVGGSLGPVGGLPGGPLGPPPTSSVGGTPFNPMSQTSQAHQGYNPIQSITSQLHTLSMSTTMASSNSMPGGGPLGNIGGGGLGSLGGGSLGTIGGGGLGGGGLGSIGGGSLDRLGSTGLGTIGGGSLGSIGGGSLGSIGGGLSSSNSMSGVSSSSALSGLGGPLGVSSGLGGGPLGSGPLGGGPLGGGPLGGGPLGGGPLGGGPLGGGPLGGGPLGGGPLGGSGGGGSSGLGSSLGGSLGGGGLGSSLGGSGSVVGGGSGGGGSMGSSDLGSSSGRSPALGALTGSGSNPAGGKPAQPGGADRFGRSMSQQFSKEIEDEANSYFQRIYNHPPHPTISIDDVLEMLKRFKDSPVKKEREVFACMLRNLFEEYRFFPQYPDKELHTTAVLFGGIIEQGLVTYMDLGIALRYVLEALKKPHGSKMYYFGIAALDRFKTRLKDYPQYCQHLASIQHFSQFPSHLIEYVEYGARSQEPPNRPQGPVMSPSLTPNTSAATSNATPTSAVATSPAMSTTPTQGAAKPGSSLGAKRNTEHPSIANATNIDTLLAGTEGQKEDILVPPENLQDKVFFIFNNLSLSNMDVKSAELLEHLTDEYLPWVAQYMVMKRASIEPNFHRLYANFIDQLKRGEFFTMVIRETFRNIKVLLRSDKGVNNFSDRSLLKNLGHWLGLLTLAKNKPILHVDIDLKSLVYEAYYKGAQELLFVVPFVAKVLESVAKSKVFKPPNPWTMGIMNVLAELHQEEGLKLNLKFEIEVLCKTLSLDINDLKAATYLNDQERSKTIENQLSAPKPKETASTPQPEESMAVNIVNIPGSGISDPVSSLFPGVGVSATTVMSSTPTTNTTTTAASVTTPPQPQFVYHDINIMSLGGMAPHITINDQLGLFQAHPRLKQFVRPAIEHSVQELLHPVVERSIKIALTTCEQIVRKDFALDPEEARMRAAAHHMVRNMTAGMALITCREPLLISINNNLKNAFLTSLGGATQPQKELIEQAAQVIAQENTELACAFIQKTAVEKAIPEMDKRLATEFELRKHARNEGRRYCDPVVLTYQAERMPEQIRLKLGGVTPQQIAVYEEFARNIPGFLASPPQTSQDNTLFKAAQAPQQSYVMDEITQIYDKIARDIEQHLHAVPVSGHTAPRPQVTQLHVLLEAVLVARNSRDIATALELLKKAVEGLLDGLQSMPPDHELNFRFRDCHLIVLKGLQDHRAYGAQWTNKQVTRWLIECREEYRYNLEAVIALIHSHLVNMQQYDSYLASAMENGLNYVAVAFAITLVQRFCLDDKQGQQVNEADFFATIETLARIAAHSRQAPEGLTTLIETIRQRNDGSLLDKAPTMMCSGISQAREFDDPPGLHEKTEYLLREWVTMYHSPAAGRDSTKAFSAFVTQMHQHGILKTDDLITRFFRLCTEMCVDLCYRALAEQSASPTMVRAKCFHTLDAFVRLIALLVKHSGEPNNTATKINLLSKVLGIVAGVLLQDHEVRHTDFQQLPYHRIFIMLFIELNVPEHVLESINYQVLTAFCNAFHILRPAKAPGFAYAWLELISHRVYIGRLLAVPPQQRGWNMYAQLLIDLFKFLVPFLRNADLAKPTQLLYKGTLRVLLILLHDFPEFLCDYHYAFCDVIPPNCIQMRNLILSAFPRNMRLPDPFTPNLKVDMLSDIAHPPRIMTNYTSAIQPASFKKDLDSYLKTRSPVTFLSELRSNLQVSNEPGVRYNVQMMNALVLYVGTQAISHIQSKGLTPSMSTIAHSSHMDIFQNLAVDLDTRGRYLFLSSIANQLRFPNSHTHYFSCTLLYLFSEANTEAIQEQITRVLLERLIVNRPHPWGLLITFIELIKNPQFKFWNHEFVHCAPEIEKLFESVARSCIQSRQQQAMRDQEVQEVH